MKFTSLILLFALTLAPFTAYAQEIVIPTVVSPSTELSLGLVITPLRKGQPAPFTGVELSPLAVAQIIADTNAVKDRLALEVGHARAVALGECDFKLSEQKTNDELKQKTLQAALNENLARINILQEQLKKEQSSIPTSVWVGAGFGAGILVTLATVYAVTQVTK